MLRAGADAPFNMINIEWLNLVPVRRNRHTHAPCDSYPMLNTETNFAAESFVVGLPPHRQTPASQT